MTQQSSTPKANREDLTQMHHWGRKAGEVEMAFGSGGGLLTYHMLNQAGEYLLLADPEAERPSLYAEFAEGLRNTPGIWQSLISDVLWSLRDHANHHANLSGMNRHLDWTGYTR